MDRLTRPEYFMGVAEDTGSRGTCLRLQVGCVIVGSNKIRAVGYTSSHKGTSHCMDIGCLLEDGHCVRCLHAEMPAVINIEIIRDENLIAFITHTPCINCYKLLTSRGVNQIVVLEEYGEMSKAYVQLVREVSVPHIDFKYYKKQDRNL